MHYAVQLNVVSVGTAFTNNKRALSFVDFTASRYDLVANPCIPN